MDRAANDENPLTECAEVPDNAYKDGMVCDEAIQTLRRVQHQPFFLAVGFYKPHTPFNAPKRYWDLYDRDAILLAKNPFRPNGAPDIAMNAWRYVRSFRHIPKQGPLSDDLARQVRHGYFACCSYVDAQVGRLLDELDRLGLGESTIVLMWSDHGYQLGEHGMWCKHTNFETSVRVPLVIRVPQQARRGAACEAIVELIDMYPTLVELARLPAPSHLEGTSFAPLLEDPGQPWKRAAFSQYQRGVCLGRSIRTSEFRYNEWRHTKTGQLVAQELYDHRRDPFENENVVARPAYRETVQRLAQQLAAGWLAANPNLVRSQPSTDR
jgi:arylsulfatase A-like enzyme